MELQFWLAETTQGKAAFYKAFILAPHFLSRNCRLAHSNSHQKSCDIAQRTTFYICTTAIDSPRDLSSLFNLTIIRNP